MFEQVSASSATALAQLKPAVLIFSTCSDLHVFLISVAESG